MNINTLIKGNKKFRKITFPKFDGDINDLIEQKQEILFIGCSDNKVTPTVILDTKAEDMFILKNIGNFVPPYKKSKDFHGSSAVIEYAISILKVKHIIVCGHSYCGACRSLYKNLRNSSNLIHVKKWLELGKIAKEYSLLAIQDKSNMEILYRATERISVVHQLENLLTFPGVEKKIKVGELQIHGWYYRMEDGVIESYDGKSCCFNPLKG